VKESKLKKGCYRKDTSLKDVNQYFFLSHNDIGMTDALKKKIINKFGS